MSYLLGGSAGESTAFEKTIANSAIEVLHESQGIVGLTSVVAPNQGNVYKQPSMSPVSFADYDEAASDGVLGEQTVTLTAKEITATPAVAQTGFGKFIGWTTAFDLAANLGAEIGMSFGEKVDQRVAGAFAGFKATGGNTNFTANASISDGFARVSALGCQELCLAASTVSANTSAYGTKTVLGLVRNVVKAWRSSRNPGRPVIVLGPEEESRLLSELTAQTSAGDLSALGNELQSTGMIRNVYGAQLVFTTFLSSASRAFNDGTETVGIGAAFGPQALTTVMNQGLSIQMGDQPGGLKTWVTGLGYFGAGVSSTARGMAINIELS